MSLKNMRRFFQLAKRQTVSVQSKCSWSHFCELLKFDDTDKIGYYINIASKQNLSVRKLREKIKSNEYEKLSDATKSKIINKEKISIKNDLLNPIIINTNNKNIDTFNEKNINFIIAIIGIEAKYK